MLSQTTEYSMITLTGEILKGPSHRKRMQVKWMPETAGGREKLDVDQKI